MIISAPPSRSESMTFRTFISNQTDKTSGAPHELDASTLNSAHRIAGPHGPSVLLDLFSALVLK